MANVRIKANPKKKRAVLEAMLRMRYRVGSNQPREIHRKYAQDEFVVYGTRRKVRKLSDQEVSEFRRAIELRISRKVRVAGACSDVAGGLTEPYLDKTPTESMSNIVGKSVFSTTKGIDRNAVVGEGAAATVKRTASRKKQAPATSRRAVV
jgi:hypothetical protein